MQSSITREYFLKVVGSEMDPEEERTDEIDDLLKRSENLILAYISPNGQPEFGNWVDSICSAIQMDMMMRVWHNRRGLASEAMGPESQSFVAPGGLMILPAERETLDRIKVAHQTGGIGTLRTTRRDFSEPDMSYLWGF